MLKTLRKNLKFFRQREDLSQEELSRKCNYDKTYVGKIERGDTNPSVEAILRIADVLSITAVDLLEPDVSDRPETFREQLENPSGSASRLFADVFNNTPSICFLTNDDGEILHLNTAAKKFLKADANDLIGQKIHEMPFWGQTGVNPSVFEELGDLGSLGKKATRRVSLRYKGKELDLQVQVSYAELSDQSSRFVIFQLFFVEETVDRTLVGDHFDLLRD